MSRQLSIIVFILTGLYFVLFFAWPIGETLRGAFFTTDGTLTLVLHHRGFSKSHLP